MIGFKFRKLGKVTRFRLKLKSLYTQLIFRATLLILTIFIENFKIKIKNFLILNFRKLKGKVARA